MGIDSGTARIALENAVQNGLLPLPLFVFRLRSIWDGLHVTIIEGTIAEPAYIMYGERLPCGSFLRRLES